MINTALAAELTGRQARWEIFTSPGGRPGFFFLVRCPDPDAPPRPPQWPSHRKERLEWIWADYQRQVERAAWLQDDFVPRLSMITGTEIFAEAFGCPVHRPADNMPFALPAIHSPADVARLKVPDLATSSLAYLFEMADELARRGGPDAPFQLVDIQSPMDIAALVMEKEVFFTAMFDSPEAVKELAGKVRQLLAAFLDEWFRRYGARYIAHYPDYAMKGGMTLSEDEVGIVSPDMFEEFFLPELAFLSQRYGGLGMHCCANSRHQWHHFLRIPGLRVLNLVQPAPVLKEAYPFFAPHVVQMHGNIAEGPAETWPAQYPPGARIVLESWVKTRDEALDAARRFGSAREQTRR